MTATATVVVDNTSTGDKGHVLSHYLMMILAMHLSRPNASLKTIMVAIVQHNPAAVSGPSQVNTALNRLEAYG